jgi:hypothetical protein
MQYHLAHPAVYILIGENHAILGRKNPGKICTKMSVKLLD